MRSINHWQFIYGSPGINLDYSLGECDFERYERFINYKITNNYCSHHWYTKVVEIDETMVGGKRKGKRGRGAE